MRPSPAYTTFEGAPLTPDQVAAVTTLLTNARDTPFVGYLRDGAPLIFPSRHEIQQFAAFASVGFAYEIHAPFFARSRFRDGDQFECVSVLVDGQAVLEYPDEGGSGVLHLQRRHRDGVPGNWVANFLACGSIPIRALAGEG